jgi:hypothetical protein
VRCRSEFVPIRGTNGAANAASPRGSGVDIIEEVRRRHPVVAQVRESERRLERPIAWVRRALLVGASRRREGEADPRFPRLVSGGQEKDLLPEPRSGDRTQTCKVVSKTWIGVRRYHQRASANLAAVTGTSRQWRVILCPIA